MIAYSQIIGINQSQKKEVVKGLFAESEYKKVIADNQKDIADYLKTIEAQNKLIESKDEIIKAKEDIVTGQGINIDIYGSRIQQLEKDNKKLRRGTLVYKILLGVAVAAYTYERIR